VRYDQLNKVMVEQGWATAFRKYTDAYVAEEIRARQARRGIWSSTFMQPEDFARRQLHQKRSLRQVA
jgi:endonuclease YncB( thermonuclease family)